MENYLYPSPASNARKATKKIRLCLSVKEHPFNADNPDIMPFEDIGFIDFKKETLSICVPRSFKDKGYVDPNEVFIRPLSCLLNNSGYYALHGSLVNGKNDFVVFSGQGGRGKSTLSCVMALNGFDLLCDDMMFVNKTRGNIDIIPLRTYVKIDNAEKKRFIDVGNIKLTELTFDKLPKKLFFIFPDHRQSKKPALRSIPKKEGVMRLIADNLVFETGHTDNRTSRINTLDFICRLGEDAPFFELCYNDGNLMEAGRLVKWHVGEKP